MPFVEFRFLETVVAPAAERNQALIERLIRHVIDIPG
jgi:hypothetical protein